MKVSNPSGQICEFNEKYHTCTIIETGEKLSSVSKVQRSFFPEFNAKKIAAMCQKKPEYSGMLPDDIVNLWSREGDLSRKEGDCVHNMIKCYVNEESMVEPISMRCVRLFKCALDALSIYKRNYEIAGTEMLVFSEFLGVAGFVDLLLKRNDSFLIVDWKTNKEIKKENKYEKAKRPIEKLDNCNLNQYVVQLNILKKILMYENYYGSQNFRPEIVHLQEYGKAVRIPVKAMDKQINKMLEIWKGD